MMNVLNGGQHASGSTDIQEMMIVPVGAKSIYQAVQMGTEIFHTLGRNLRSEGYATTVGDEGGYAPALSGAHRKALDMIVAAIKGAGYEPGRDVALALDVAATELVTGQGYHLDNHAYTAEELIRLYGGLARDYPIVSIEDGLDEDDWSGWTKFTARFGNSLQLVGDDLLVTNTALLERAIKEDAANAILVKPNQIGTLSETIAAVKMAQGAGWRTIMSHRSGETEDTTIAHLAVGLGAGQIKTGSLSRTDRTAKYNELMRIAENQALVLARPFAQG
jgi:enolase